MIRTAATSFILAFGVAAACSPSAPAGDSPAGPDTGTDVMGGAASSIRLLPVTAQNADSLEGELRCGFTDEDERNTLFLAAANVGDEYRATAVINNRGMGITLVASEPGGFSTLDDGGTFDSQVFTATLVPGEEIDGGQSEAQKFPAQLTVKATDGTEVTVDGLWTCGP